MTTIIVKKDFSPQEERRAAIKATEFRPSKAASQADKVLDFADCQKAVMLCFDHARKFDRRTQMKYGYYMQKEYPHVVANCDACGAFGMSHLFIHETVLKEVWRTRDQARRDREYATIV